MKTSLAHLPDSKRRRIEGIGELLQREAGVIMVILFGSYARGIGSRIRATEFWHSSGYFARRNQPAHAAFVLHQAAERYYHATLLVSTGYKPKTHNLEELAEETEVLHPALANAIPRAEGRDKELFELLRRAYIEARYSRSYRITLEELGILRERVRELAIHVRFACEDRLASFCGPEAVGSLPDPLIGLAEELLKPSFLRRCRSVRSLGGRLSKHARSSKALKPGTLTGSSKAPSRGPRSWFGRPPTHFKRCYNEIGRCSRNPPS